MRGEDFCRPVSFLVFPNYTSLGPLKKEEIATVKEQERKRIRMEDLAIGDEKN